MEEYYRTLLYALPEIVYQVDIEGNFIYVNDSISQLGYTPEELLGKHFTMIVAEEDRPFIDRDFFLLDKKSSAPIIPHPLFFNERRTGGRITRNLKVRLKCGKIPIGDGCLMIDGEVFATGLYETREHGGNFIGTIGIIRELSDDAEQEKTIIRIERFYRLLIDNSLDVITILAHDGMILYMSKSIERSLGLAPMHFIGENIGDITHPDDSVIIADAFTGINGYSRDAQRVEFRYRHADESWRYFESSFIRVMDDDKRHVMCYILHSMDITRRKIAEASLANRERVYRQLLRISPDAIALFDHEGDLIMANDKAVEITGIARGDLIGMNYLSMICHEDRKEAHLIRKIISNDGILRNFQFIHLRPAGGKVPLEMSISAIRNETCDLEGYITVFRDITERKEAEIELLKLQSELEEERNLLRERNNVIENDLGMARNILLNLTPSVCFYPGVAFYYKPMDIVGGDFYDFIQFRDRAKIGIFICDVSGHGLPAAFITSMIKTTIDQAGQVRENPAMLLALLNDMLIPVSSGNFVTALYGIYDGNNRTLTYAKAGHNNPYRITETSIDMIRSVNRCIPLGILNNLELEAKSRGYSNETVPLIKGEKVLIYTDGLTETRRMRINRLELGIPGGDPDKNDFESSGLMEAIRDNSHLTPQLYIDKIITTLNEFRGTDSMEDDLCLICIEIN